MPEGERFPYSPSSHSAELSRSEENPKEGRESGWGEVKREARLWVSRALVVALGFSCSKQERQAIESWTVQNFEPQKETVYSPEIGWPPPPKKQRITAVQLSESVGLVVERALASSQAEDVITATLEEEEGDEDKKHPKHEHETTISPTASSRPEEATVAPSELQHSHQEARPEMYPDSPPTQVEHAHPLSNQPATPHISTESEKTHQHEQGHHFDSHILDEHGHIDAEAIETHGHVEIPILTERGSVLLGVEKLSEPYSGREEMHGELGVTLKELPFFAGVRTGGKIVISEHGAEYAIGLSTPEEAGVALSGLLRLGKKHSASHTTHMKETREEKNGTHKEGHEEKEEGEEHVPTDQPKSTRSLLEQIDIGVKLHKGKLGLEAGHKEGRLYLVPEISIPIGHNTEGPKLKIGGLLEFGQRGQKVAMVRIRAHL